ncbi:MAG TPA: hypothetical protein VMT82_09100 [candidate division Zixibacteria bacterium]|nr:hypothetical protein [candidate division Zixibacteria bacterium]
MNIGDKIKSGMGYAGDLADTGWKGARAAASAALNGEPAGHVLTRSAQASWAATLVGAAVGALVGYLVNTRKPSISRVGACAVIGGTVGFGSGLAWETRGLSSGIARGAMRNINKARDQHWLASHPIDFG